MADTWDSLTFDQQSLLAEKMETKDLAKRFEKEASFFEHFRAFVKTIPTQTVAPKAKPHSPPKDLVISARRDLSFYEATYELIDNSIDAWRVNGAKRDLHIDITYDLELLTGRYVDDAGGLEEKDVYKVFIPGETTNTDFQQRVIGSFGMGAKKGIFRLTDGAKIVSCKNTKFSATSQVPEKWEESPNWETDDGRAKPTTIGKTELYFFKLVAPPTISDIATLIQRCSVQYRPLLAGELVSKKLVLTINETKVEAGRAPLWSGAKGASPRKYVFSQTFKNLLDTGNDIRLGFTFICGLTQKSAGKDAAERDADWGIDVFGNGRLIEPFRKSEFGFGTKNLSMRSSAMSYFRAELFIDGHSFAIPWDTHKREYLEDHPVSDFLRQRLRPILKAVAKIANTFGSEKQTRNEYLEGLPFSSTPKTVTLSETPKATELPVWGYGEPAKKTRSEKKGKKGATEEGDEEDETDAAEVVDSEEDEAVIELTMPRGDRDALLERFELSDADDLATALVDCLSHGVAFALSTAEFKAAKKALKCADANEVSLTLRQSLVSKLAK